MGKFCREEHQHQYISKEFKTLDEIMDWMHAEELDTQFSCKGGYTSFEAAAKHRRMPNKIYWCNKNPRTKSYVPKRGEKSSSRKLPPGQRCPAIIQIRAHEVFSNPKGIYNFCVGLYQFKCILVFKSLKLSVIEYYQ